MIYPTMKTTEDMAETECKGRCYANSKFTVTSCIEKHPSQFLFCTLPFNHEGPHIACGGSCHDIMIWPQGDQNDIS